MNERDIRSALSPLVPPAGVARLAAAVAGLPEPEGAIRVLQNLGPGGIPADPGRLQAVLTLAGHSPFLGGLIAQNPKFLDILPGAGPGRGPRPREDLQEDLARFQSLHAGEEVSTVLRRFKRRELLRIALADFLRTADLSAITLALSQLAEVLLDRAVSTALEPLRRRHGPPTFRDDRGHLEEAVFAVIGMGKLGGEELNYSSDIDLIYLFSRDGETAAPDASAAPIANREFFRRLATEVTRLIAGHGPEGQVFRVDLGLRPGGRDGDLVISLGAAVAYYRNWAEPWERQALLKARAVAGDLELGRRFVAQMEPLVYEATPDPYRALEIGAMKDRVDARLAAAGRAESDVKLGRGGIREIEFALQALQLQHGGADPWLRQGNTLLALHRLAEKGYLDYPEYAGLARAYTFLRDLEHRLQLGHDRQTSTLPGEEHEMALLARRMGFGSDPRGETAALLAELERQRATVRGFYDTVVGRAAQASIDEEPVDPLLDRVDDEALKERLRGAGFPRPEAALRPLKLIRRTLRAAADSPALRRDLRRAGPAVLRAAGRTLHPKRALENLEKLLASLSGPSERLLRLLMRPGILAPTIGLLGRSDLLAGLVIRQPGILRGIEDRGRILRAPDPEDQRRLLLEVAARRAAPPAARAGQIRRRHQEALAMIALRDINGQATLRETLKSLSDLAGASVEAAVALGRDQAGENAPALSPDLRLAVLGLGRLGYRELDYLSDLDLVFVYEAAGPEEETARATAARWAAATVRTLSALSRDGQLYRVDLRLRPSGGEGDIAVSRGRLAGYLRGEAEIWEMQSFLKARPVAGDRELGERAATEIESTLLERAAGLGAGVIARAVEEMERRLRGGSPRERAGIKLGEGGILDVHFAIEFLQLAHAVPSPRDKDTPRLLAYLHTRGLIDGESLRRLYEGYLFLRALDHTMRLVHDRPLEELPADTRGLDELARALDWPEAAPSPGGRRLLERVRAHRRAIREAYEAIVPAAARAR